MLFSTLFRPSVPKKGFSDPRTSDVGVFPTRSEISRPPGVGKTYSGSKARESPTAKKLAHRENISAILIPPDLRSKIAFSGGITRIPTFEKVRDNIMQCIIICRHKSSANF